MSVCKILGKPKVGFLISLGSWPNVVRHPSIVFCQAISRLSACMKSRKSKGGRARKNQNLNPNRATLQPAYSQCSLISAGTWPNIVQQPRIVSDSQAMPCFQARKTLGAIQGWWNESKPESTPPQLTTLHHTHSQCFPISLGTWPNVIQHHHVIQRANIL